MHVNGGCRDEALSAVPEVTWPPANSSRQHETQLPRLPTAAQRKSSPPESNRKATSIRPPGLHHDCARASGAVCVHFMMRGTGVLPLTALPCSLRGVITLLRLAI